MKLFWIVLVLVLLFVIGSASMLRYFGNKPIVKKDDQDQH